MTSMTAITSKPVQHYPWCDPGECYTNSDPEDGYESHYGHRTGVHVRAAETTWRNECGEDPRDEVVVRSADHDGHLFVEVAAGHALDVRADRTSSGSVGVSWLTADEARAMAGALRAVAAAVEVGR